MKPLRYFMATLLALPLATVGSPAPAQAALDDVLTYMNIDEMFSDAESYKNSLDYLPVSINSGREFDPYEFSYFYNIGDKDFASIRLQWEQKSDTTVVASLGSGVQNRSFTPSSSFLTPQLSRGELTIEAKNFCTSTFDGDGDCPAGSEAPRSTLTLEVQRGGATQRTYQFQIVRRLTSDSTRFKIWTEAEPESPSWDSGEPPADRFAYRGYVQVPDANTMEKNGSFLAGWKSKDLFQTYPLESYVYLDQDLELVPNWVSDVPTGLVEVEGGPEVDSDPASPSTLHEVFVDQTPANIQLAFSDYYRIEAKLFLYPGDNEIPIDSIDTAFTARSFLDLTGPCSDPGDAECNNLFRLELTFYSGSGESSRIINAYLLRQTDPDTDFTATISWAQDDQTIETMRQGWFQFPESAPGGRAAFTELTRFRGNPLGAAEDFLPGGYAPIFSNQSFDALELVLQPELEIFGEAMSFQTCPEGFCLNFDGQLLSPVDNYFLITVDASSLDFASSADDASQSLKVDWVEDPSATADSRWATVTSLDHRFEDFSSLNEDVTNLGGKMADSFLCEESGCHLAWELQLNNEISETQFFEYWVMFVLAPNGYSFDIDFAIDDTSEPNRTEEEPYGWLELPPSNSYSKEDHQFRFWSSESNTRTRFDYNFYPVLGPDKIFAVWQELFQIRFMNGDELIQEREITSEWLLRDFEVTLPTSEYEFLGWSLERNGSVLPSTHEVATDTTFFAVWDVPPELSSPQPVLNPSPVVVAPEIPAPPSYEKPSPEISEQPSGPQPIRTKTHVEVSIREGITSVEAVVPAKYVNRPARIEIRRVIGGKVRYYLIGKAWTHFDRKRNDYSKAAMTFRFPLELKAEDVIRVKVRGVQVIRAKGDGTPAWR